MLSSSLRSSASRRLVSSRTASPRSPLALPRSSARWNSSSSSQAAAGNATNYVLAGAAGGGLVLLGGYSYYHFSGAKTLVDSARSVKSGVVSAKNQLVEKTPSPNEAITYLRNISKSYVALVPGASKYVDKTFDSLDELSQTHGEEVNAIVSKAVSELQDTIKNGQMDLPTAQKVYEILKTRGEELTKLAAEAGGGAIQKLIEEHPELKDKLSGGWSQLKELGEQSGAPEAKKLVEDTTAQVVDIFKNGFSVDSITKARTLIKEKTEEAKKLADKASKAAYDKGLEAAQPYLEKAPDVKKLIEENASVLSTAGAGSSVAAIWTALKSAAKDKTPSGELTKLVQSKIDEVKQKSGGLADMAVGEGGDAWSGIQSFVQTAVPGAKDIPDLSALIAAAKDNSEDAQKLAQSTYSEILEVLKSKAEEAKKLGQNAKEDAKSGESKEKKDDSSKEDKDEKGESEKKEKKDSSKQNKKDDKKN